MALPAGAAYFVVISVGSQRKKKVLENAKSKQ
jgi:hypothetical protein